MHVTTNHTYRFPQLYKADPLSDVQGQKHITGSFVPAVPKEGAMFLPKAPRGDRSIQLKSKRNFSGHMVFRRDANVASAIGLEQVLDTDSHLEMKIALILSVRPQVEALENQVLFEWFGEQGAKKRHFFDFRASLSDGSRMAVIVKRSGKLTSPEFRAKTQQIAANMRKEFADRVIVMTDRDVDPIEIYNASFLNGLNEVDQEADLAAMSIMGEMQVLAPLGTS